MSLADAAADAGRCPVATLCRADKPRVVPLPGFTALAGMVLTGEGMRRGRLPAGFSGSCSRRRCCREGTHDGGAGARCMAAKLIIFIGTQPPFPGTGDPRRREYAAAGVPMLPVTHGVDFTRWQIPGYTMMLLAVSLLPFALGWRGPFYLAGALALGIGFVVQALRLFAKPDEARALSAFGYSIFYLAMLFAFLLADHWVQRLTG